MVKITRKKSITGMYKKVIPHRLQEEYPELLCNGFNIYTLGGEYRPGLQLFRRTSPVAKFDYHVEGEHFKLWIHDPAWETRMIAFFESLCDEAGIPELIVVERLSS